MLPSARQNVDALFEASDLIGLMTAFIAVPRNDGSRSHGQRWGSREGQLRVDGLNRFRGSW